jgi:hypothetical protein
MKGGQEMGDKKTKKKVKVEDLPLDKDKNEEALKAVKGGAWKKKPAKK